MVLEIFTPLDWRRQSISTQNFPKLIPIPGGKSEKFQTSDPVLLPPMDIHQLLITRAQIGSDCSASSQLFCVYGHSFTAIMQYRANYIVQGKKLSLPLHRGQVKNLSHGIFLNSFKEASSSPAYSGSTYY